MSAPQPPVWVDDQTPDPTWAPPAESARAPVRRKRWRPPPWVVVVTGLALVVAAVWAVGGFRPRTDLRIDIAPGTLIVTGPYEFTFTRATAQRVNRFGSKWVVEVLVYGKGRTTGDEAMAPSTLNPMFAARDEKTREVRAMEGQRFGPGATYGNGDTFTPGLAPVDYTVTFEFSDNYRPGATIAFSTADLEYSDTTLLRTGEKSWNNADHLYIMQLPITRLPDKK